MTSVSEANVKHTPPSILKRTAGVSRQPSLRKLLKNKQQKKTFPSGYATNAQVCNVPLKSVLGCQVIEEETGSSAHRVFLLLLRAPSRAPERRVAERERDPITSGHRGGNGDTAAVQNGRQGAMRVVP